MTVQINDLDFKYLHKKLCCQNCHYQIVRQFNELATPSDVIIALTKLRQMAGRQRLSAKLERQIDGIIKEKQK